MSAARPPGLVISLLEAALPASIAEAFVGDLVEEFRMRARREPAEARVWLYGQLLRSVIPLLLLGLRRGDPRIQVASAAGSMVAGALGWAAQRALWTEVLVHVPLRAGHPPTPGWLFFGAVLFTVFAALGGLLGGALARAVVLQGGKER